MAPENVERYERVAKKSAPSSGIHFEKQITRRQDVNGKLLPPATIAEVVVACIQVEQIASRNPAFGGMRRGLRRAKQAALQGEFLGAVDGSRHRLSIEALNRRGHSV